MSLEFLVAGSETADEQAARRAASGASSAESYANALRALEPGCRIEAVSCVDPGAAPPDGAALRAFDAVFFPGSPIQMHVESPETLGAAAFMRAVFASGVPAFGSCAGLQIATVAAGGTVRTRPARIEAAFARGIVATEAGRDHPLLRGRPLAWDAPAMHESEVATLPAGAVVLARTQATPVQAAEIHHAGGTFWGVQYHPELTLAEIAASLRRQAADLVETGLAEDEAAVARFADRIDALGREPGRRDLAWQLGLGDEITDPARRMVELRNFIDHRAKRRRPIAA